MRSPTPATITEFRATVRLAVPVVLGHLGMMMLGVVDVMMVGRHSMLALDAANLGHISTMGLMILAQGLFFALDPLVAQAVGARRGDRITDAVHRGLVLSVVLAVPLALIFLVHEPVLHALTGNREVAAGASGYARAVAAGVPFFFVFLVVRQTLQAMSIVRPVVAAVVIGNLVNVALNYVFVFGHFGMPELGAVGAGWASTGCRALMAAAIVLLGLPALRPYVFRRPQRRLLDLGPYLFMLRKGGQIGLQMALEVWAFMCMSILALRLGELQMAGHNIAMNLASLSFMVPVGIGAAAATRVGNAIGRGDLPGARRAAKVALLIGGAVMTVFAIAFALAPSLLARLYTGDAAIVGMAASLLPIAAIFQVFDGTQAVGCGILRGAADTRAAAWINLFGYWALGVPVGALLAFSLGIGTRGLWWGLTVGLATVAVLLVIRIHRKIGVEGALAPVVAREAE